MFFIVKTGKRRGIGLSKRSRTPEFWRCLTRASGLTTAREDETGALTPFAVPLQEEL